MEEIITRLKNKTFTEEDIQKLYEYYKGSTNKELIKEISELYSYSVMVHKIIKNRDFLFTGCEEFNQFLEYYFKISKLIPNLMDAVIPPNYSYHLNLSKVIDLC